MQENVLPYTTNPSACITSWITKQIINRNKNSFTAFYGEIFNANTMFLMKNKVISTGNRSWHSNPSDGVVYINVYLFGDETRVVWIYLNVFREFDHLISIFCVA